MVTETKSEEQISGLKDLTKFDFKGKSLAGGNFVRVNMSGVDLRVIKQVYDSTPSHILGRRVVSLDLKGIDLTGSNLSDAIIALENVGADLSHSILNDAVMKRVELASARISFASLNRIDLTKANLEYTLITNSSARGAILAKANLERSLISSTMIDTSLGVDNIHLDDWRGADLGEANLKDAVITRVDLTGANLKDADLTGAKLHLVNLKDANLEGVIGLDKDQLKTLSSNHIPGERGPKWIKTY